jgi:hypothetical protein
MIHCSDTVNCGAQIEYDSPNFKFTETSLSESWNKRTEIVKKSDEVEFKIPPNYADKMTMSDWMQSVGDNGNAFIEEDGFGHIGTNDKESNIPVEFDSSHVYPEWATHVYWYNR